MELVNSYARALDKHYTKSEYVNRADWCQPQCWTLGRPQSDAKYTTLILEDSNMYTRYNPACLDIGEASRKGSQITKC